ncbi:MAG TPA: DeoR family transcriptional regulator [Candidatus Sulfomarinibacteraceae bacterium]|nr:DeoR family transcriptional regulator [Candidatus Sulfomarinibacteraceae bacterium]
MKIVTDNSKESTRDIILHTIKLRHQATVNELAEAADVSPVTVRHHLNSLQAESLLKSDSVRRKVGRPYHVYSLSKKGHELFPKRYARLSTRLLEELKKQFPAEVVTELFHNVVAGIVEEHREQFEGLPFEERLSYLVDMLAEEGFLARWEKIDDEYHLIEYSCPYISVGEEHMEICSFDKELIISVLDTDVKQHSCMLNGDHCCEFSFTKPLSN